eukprot:2540979-Alexandrium_andersonii.AAC.1
MDTSMDTETHALCGTSADGEPKHQHRTTHTSTIRRMSTSRTTTTHTPARAEEALACSTPGAVTALCKNTVVLR